MSNTQIPVIDLFAGAGGLGLGVKQASGDLRLSIELDHFACETLRANQKKYKHKVIEGDVCSLKGEEIRRHAGLKPSDALVIVGGAPCQPFSKAAYWTDPGDDSRFRRARERGEDAERPNPILTPRKDERRSLVRQFWRLVVESKADGFVFENVPSLLHPRNKPTLLMLIEAFEKEGYKLTLLKAMATEFGVPQMRERIFLLGMKKEKPIAPEPMYAKKPDSLSSRPRPISTGQVIEPFSGNAFFEPEEVIKGKWENELFEVPPGWNYKALTAWAGHANPVFEAETRFWNFLLKLCPTKPSWTIAASPGPWTGPFHWSNRRLRTVEMAALQTFPRGYEFIGSRREKVRQIGNAVPAKLAEKISENLLKQIAGEKVNVGSNELEVIL